MESGSASELRLESRSNIFVMAALYTGNRAPAPVRIRNLSRTGALVEANVLPSPGAQVRLARANLATPATVMWVEGSKAGLRFTSPIAVSEWLPQQKRGIGQQFADELFHQKRLQSGDSPAFVGHVATLLELKQSLERTSKELALDASVATRHRMALQAIDAVSLTLADLANTLAENGDGEVGMD